MSTPHVDVDDVDRLASVTLSSAIEPGDLRVTGIVSELGDAKVLDYLEAAGDVAPLAFRPRSGARPWRPRGGTGSPRPGNGGQIRQGEGGLRTPDRTEPRNSVPPCGVTDGVGRCVLGEATCSLEVRSRTRMWKGGKQREVPVRGCRIQRGRSSCPDARRLGVRQGVSRRRYFRESRVMRIAPISEAMILHYISHRVLGMPKSY